ncbi:hypothetical protein PR048_031130 [Dryococelus australis]|uniref:Uncharacterized protein n=1 Tax=Dryococelus australis TaxID=614101 RepID=A0ABQ9G8G4_9NEOP|nr:hypothetical protein PR048_031130 [Dryococelus australis]
MLGSEQCLADNLEADMAEITFERCHVPWHRGHCDCMYALPQLLPLPMLWTPASVVAWFVMCCGGYVADLATGVLNGGTVSSGADSTGGLVLGRGPSPSLSISTTIASLNGGTAFPTLSGTPSPILSQPEDLEPLASPLPLALNGTGGMAPPPSGFQLMRSTSGKATPMPIRYKYGQLGPGKGQFNSPHGFCLGIEEDIIVADTNNHRIQTFEKTGTFKFQFGIPGKEEGQLWYPRKVAVMRNSGKFVVCDRGNERSRMQIFTKSGHFIKKIAIRYIDIVAGLAVTAQGHIVAVDSVSPTVFVISEVGDLLRWFDCSDYMREPSDIAISGKEFYVCDFKGHCVVVFSEDGLFLRRIGGENITNFPNGIDISDAGDVLVGDSHGNRFHVAVFSRDGTLLCEFECPYVKVSGVVLIRKLTLHKGNPHKKPLKASCDHTTNIDFTLLHYLSRHFYRAKPIAKPAFTVNNPKVAACRLTNKLTRT